MSNIDVTAYKEEVERIAKFISSFVIEIGVIDGQSKARDGDGVTNAELMYIHEYGSIARNIPARPVLQLTIDDVRQRNKLVDRRLDKIVEDCVLERGYDEAYITKQLNILANEVAQYAKDLIQKKDERLQKSERDKTTDHMALFDTGQLSRSIVGRAIKKNS